MGKYYSQHAASARATISFSDPRACAHMQAGRNRAPSSLPTWGRRAEEASYDVHRCMIAMCACVREHFAPPSLWVPPDALGKCGGRDVMGDKRCAAT